MNETSKTDNTKEQKVKSPALFNVESFNKAVASRDEIISSHAITISTLEEQIGNQQTSISSLIKERDAEKAARIEAENELAELKNLKKNSSFTGGSYKLKSEEEQFAENYQKAAARLRK